MSRPGLRSAKPGSAGATDGCCGASISCVTSGASSTGGLVDLRADHPATQPAAAACGAAAEAEEVRQPLMTPFSQASSTVRCEWGPSATSALAPAEVTIVVDVFSFTTCVDVAVARGAAILPYPWGDASAAEFAQRHGAELAGKRNQARYSLAPDSYLEVSPGFKCVLPSPNGGQVTLAAARGCTVALGGCLRSAPAVAEAARELGRTVNVIPAGERWPDGTLRPALKDWLGAGAVVRRLPGKRSPEADRAGRRP